MPAHIVPNRKIDVSFEHILSLSLHVPVTSLCMLNVSIAVKGWLTEVLWHFQHKQAVSCQGKLVYLDVIC